MRRILLVAAAATLCVACGKSSDSSGGQDAGAVDAGPRDVRVTPPAADPTYYDIVTPEEIVPAGQERQFCYYQTNTQGDIAISDFEPYQGKFGHHMAIVKTKDGSQKPDGTLEDCSDISSMAIYTPFLLPVSELPSGYGTLVKNNEQFVVQFHYVNSGTQDILIRDVARLKMVPVSSVTNWVSAFTSIDLNLNLPAHQTTTTTFDCTIPQDLKLLLLAGHMHELGTKFETDIGSSTSTLEPAYTVDPWSAAYRDAPPANIMFTNPMQLHQGDILRTSCTWNNTTDNTLAFPQEMCVTIGYVVGTQTAVLCEQ